MSEVKLSFRQLKTYLNKLQKAGLLEMHYGKGRYLTTGEGFHFLQKWIEMRQMVLNKGDFSLIRNPILTKDLETLFGLNMQEKSF